jgi:hypothetical protein
MPREPEELPAGEDVVDSPTAPTWVTPPNRAPSRASARAPVSAPVDYPFWVLSPTGLRPEDDDDLDDDSVPEAGPALGPAQAEAGRRLLISVAVLALVLLIATGLSRPVPEPRTSTPIATRAATPEQPTPTQAGPTPTSPTQPSPTSAPPARSTVPAGFRLVSSTAGLRLAIPIGWKVRPVSNAPAEQRAADPAHPFAFVQFGGYTTVHATQLGRVRGYEQGKQRTDYVQLKLAPVTYGQADEAVDWEYTFRSSSVLHAYGRYWRVGKREYVLYALAPQANWEQTEAVLQTALKSATPQ